MNNQNKQIFIWIFIFILMIMTFNALQGDGVSGRAESLAFSDFLNKVDERQVNSVKIQGRMLRRGAC
jgi:cell division protease FtsH